jgi:putative transcriptional regulator
MKKPTIEAQIVQGLESFADALETGEDITSRFTCHKVVLNLQPTPYKPDLVKKTRLVLGMSQALFARFLGVSMGTVRAWEQGARYPQPIACRFMDEIRHDPARFRARMMEFMAPKQRQRS